MAACLSIMFLSASTVITPPRDMSIIGPQDRICRFWRRILTGCPSRIAHAARYRARPAPFRSGACTERVLPVIDTASTSFSCTMISYAASQPARRNILLASSGTRDCQSIIFPPASTEFSALYFFKYIKNPSHYSNFALHLPHSKLDKKKTAALLQQSYWIPAATYSPGPCPAKYHRR